MCRRSLGHWLYLSDLPLECNARLNRLAQAMTTLAPPYPVASLTVGVGPDLDGPAELWNAWLERRAPLPTWAVTEPGHSAVLDRLGFVVLAERPAGPNGTPPLVSWLRPREHPS